VTTEQHYARGLELLAESERYTGDNLAIWRAQRAAAHFAAAAAGAQLRADARLAAENTPEVS
jgi:hypothetical protein